MGKQIRLDRDVAALATKSAKENSRSLPKEINHRVRLSYGAIAPAKIKAKTCN